MPKALCIASLSITALLFIVFLLDMLAGIPFGKANTMMDIVFSVCSAGLAVLSFLCFRQQR